MSLLRFAFSRQTINLNKFATVIHKFYSQHTVNLESPAVQQYLKNLIIEHESLLTKPRKSTDEVKRLGEIKPVVNVLEQRIHLYDSIESLKELKSKETEDPEVQKMIREEAAIYLKRLKEIDFELQSALVEPSLTNGGVLVEITAGAGGQEAMLFARELFDMYENYAKYKDWEYDIASLEASDIGGIRKASMLIQGVGVPELMKMEAGVHRVQRVPSTEKGGRIHTSTVTVAVLPQPSEAELNIAERELHFETKRASGAGGQHVNTTDSAVRVVHLPTGTAVECQEGRSQIKNKEIALQKLRVLLLQKQQEETMSKVKAERKSQIGSGERNEKVRTYNFPQDRVTEHRPGGSTLHNIKGFMEGNELLEEVQEGLLREHRYKALQETIKSFEGKTTQEMDADKKK